MRESDAKATTDQDVLRAYEVMLGRLPENQEVVDQHLKAAASGLDLVRNIAHSVEFIERAGLHIASPQSPSPFWHFNSSIDVRGIIESHVRSDRQPMAGHYMNFLGVAAPTKVMSFLQDLGGLVGDVPIPANYHADMAEWGGTLRAVDLARDNFTMIELGCGWACWMTNTGVAAKARGLQVEVIGIEGDPTHLDYAHETLAVNGFAHHEYTLHPGIAAAGTGFALFPKRLEGGEHWGFTPVFGATLEESDKAVSSGRFESLPMVPLSRAIGDRPRIDLLHMDIQGGEAELIASPLELLSQRVAYLVIGTHTRQLEGRLLELLLGAGWALEVERPAIFNLPNGVPDITVDGIQAWRNPRFHPA